eukprot:scaffold1082_cov79-Cylindrotheca_fusiformis.AAC.2
MAISTRTKTTKKKKRGATSVGPQSRSASRTEIQKRRKTTAAATSGRARRNHDAGHFSEAISPSCQSPQMEEDDEVPAEQGVQVDTAGLFRASPRNTQTARSSPAEQESATPISETDGDQSEITGGSCNIMIENQYEGNHDHNDSGTDDGSSSSSSPPNGGDYPPPRNSTPTDQDHSEGDSVAPSSTENGHRDHEEHDDTFSTMSRDELVQHARALTNQVATLRERLRVAQQKTESKWVAARHGIGASAMQAFREHDQVLRSHVNSFVVDFVFPKRKFIRSSEEGESLLSYAVKNKRVSVPNGATAAEFVRKYSGVLKKKVNQLMRNCHANARQAYLGKFWIPNHWTVMSSPLLNCHDDPPSSFLFFFFFFLLLQSLLFPVDLENDKVPDDFAHTLLNEYRGCSEKAQDAFIYFASRILPAINPKVTMYKSKQDTFLLSDCFTITDEALGVMLIDNYWERWERQFDNPDKKHEWKTSPYFRAKYTSATKGQRDDSWGKTGMEEFYKWCNKIKKLRMETATGAELEDDIMHYFSSNAASGNNNKNATDDNQAEQQDADGGTGGSDSYVRLENEFVEDGWDSIMLEGANSLEV